MLPGMEPIWSPDGRELFYRDGAGSVYAVEIQRAPAVSAGKPRKLLDGGYRYEMGIMTRAYDITPDGEKFLATVRLEPPPSPATRMSILLDWRASGGTVSIWDTK